MHLKSLFVALCLAGGSAAQSRLARREDPQSAQVPQNETVTAKKFIVEFAEGVDSNAAVDSLTSVSGAKVLKVFDNEIFRGAAVECDDENVDTLQSHDSVAHAWSSRRIKLSPSVPTETLTEQANENGTYSIHWMTGVDQLHEEGILGKGAVVAVVDTGIEYTHPALGGGFGPGFKVAGGYDLVGNGQWPSSGDKVPDEDPIDQLGHGTHVSGIIAGKSSTFTGVAPDATLLAYKVFSTVDGTDEETLIDAFLRAYEDGADIITSSIGGQSGWANGAWAVVASRLVDQGVVVTISAGNDGDGGPYAASSGSSGENVLAIASVDASTLAGSVFHYTTALNGSATETAAAYNSVFEWRDSGADGLPFVPLGLDTTIVDEACSSLPDTTPDFTGKIVLVRRGGCNFAVKQANLAPFNAQYIVFYTNEMPLTAPSTPDVRSIIAMVQAETGQAIIDAYKAGAVITGNFSIGPEETIPVDNPYGGLASVFTSIGPTNELFIKSDVAAPGGLIYSTYIGESWAVLSGTSMACPYVAGVAALYIGKYGGRKTHGPEFAKSISARILSSGEAVPWSDGLQTGQDFDAFASVAQVGTGLINATKILNFDTQLSFAKFALNDTHHFSRYHSVDVTNNGDAPVTYSFEVQDFGGMATFQTDLEAYAAPRVAWGEEALAAAYKWVPDVSLPSAFTLAPGETKTAKVSFNYPQGLDASLLPIYSGKILVKGSNGETLGVPYLGLAADLHKDLGPVFQYPAGFPTLTSTPLDVPIADKANFTFNLSRAAQDFPNLYERLQYATTELRWDIFEESWQERDWKYPPVVGEAGYVGAATTWAGNTNANFFDPTTDDPTDVTAFPLTYVPRDIVGVLGLRFWWLGQLANGTQIAPGRYKFRFAALVPFGTPEHSDNWDVFETPAFEVLPLQK